MIFVFIKEKKEKIKNFFNKKTSSIKREAFMREGKEKDVILFQQAHLGGLSEKPSLYPVKVDSASDSFAPFIFPIPGDSVIPRLLNIFNQNPDFLTQ